MRCRFRDAGLRGLGTGGIDGIRKVLGRSVMSDSGERGLNRSDPRLTLTERRRGSVSRIGVDSAELESEDGASRFTGASILGVTDGTGTLGSRNGGLGSGRGPL